MVTMEADFGVTIMTFLMMKKNKSSSNHNNDDNSNNNGASDENDSSKVLVPICMSEIRFVLHAHLRYVITWPQIFLSANPNLRYT